ncbi:MAG: YCF48-related protein [Chloroflexota bacterium]|nr:YCF48-related protein [Chloroflexota bacterium]
MPRRSQRARRAQRRPWRVGLAAAAAVFALGGGWWLFTRTPVSTATSGTGTTLAAYRPADVHALQVSSTDERTVVFGHHRGMLVSHDGGALWSQASGANGDAMGVALAPGSRTQFAAGHDVFMRSDDGGVTWSAIHPALPGTDIHGFAASAVSANTFYAYVVGSGLFKSSDTGTTWQKAGDASGGTMSMTVAKAGGADVLYANTMDGVQRSRDGGRTWAAVPEVGSATLNAVGETVYAAAGGAVLVSTDGGMTWARKPFARGGAVLVAAAPSNPQIVYALTERLEVWRSPDGGTTWERAG